jgi:MSHA pilin protein MshA
MRNKVTGFTLIELVVVITIIAILAAFALPRYINLQSQARVAKLNAIYGSVRAAAALAHAQCTVDLSGIRITQGGQNLATCTPTGGTVDMDGVAVQMVNQYPASSNPGIVAAAQINAAADGLSIAFSGNVTTFAVVGGLAPECQFTYTEALAAGQAAVIGNLISSGC